MAITTTTVLAPQVQQEFNRMLLSTPTPSYIHTELADKKMLSKNSGDTVRMNRYSRLPAATVPLGNSGVTPPATLLNRINIDAKVDFYGQYTKINDQVTLTSSDPVMTAAAERLGESLRQTEDELVRNMMAATASFINCGSGVNGRIVAVVKSFLMGLKLLTGSAEDNKAQASLGCAA